MFSYAYRIRRLQKLHSERFMGLNAVSLPDCLPVGAVYRSSLPATPVSTPIRESWIFSEQQLRDRLCKTPSPRKCRFFDPRRSESGLNSFDSEWLDSARQRMGSTQDEDSDKSETSPEDVDSVKENETFHQKKLFVGNISYRVTTKQLREFLARFGKVVDCVIVQDHVKHWPKGYGFVTFSKVEEAQKARNTPASDLMLDGRELRLLPANQKRTSKIRVEAGAALRKKELAKEIDGDEDDDEDDNDNDATPVTPPPSPRRSADHINDLPDDVLLLILGRLDLKMRARVERVCKRWHLLTRQLWRSQEKLVFTGMFSVCHGKPLTIDILQSIARRCGGAPKHLDLSTASHVLDYKVSEVISGFCPNLEYLDLSSLRLTNVGIQQIAQRCQKLKVVLLKKCSDLGEKGLWWLLHLCKHLEHVDFTDIPKLTGQCFHMSGSRLRVVILSRCSGVTSNGFGKIAAKCLYLTELDLSDCLQMTDHDLSRLCQNLRALRILHLKGSFLTLTSEGLCSIAELPLLEELYLAQNRVVDDIVIAAVSRRCNRLRCLDISGCHLGVTDLSLSHLSRCSRLKELKISYLDKITDAGLCSLACQGQLEQLQARGCAQVGDSGVQDLVQFSGSLESLDVSGCDGVTNASVLSCADYVSSRSHALVMIVGGTSVEEDQMKHLDHVTQLELCFLNLSLEHLRPDRLERFGARDNYGFDEDEEHEGPAGADYDALQRFGHDYLENDDPLAGEDYEFS
ncbi:uncharacterized protein LOC135370928 [Ornithodoros turicata]|uniref:uncharacterized protein LOC135370928 n=1 Tax=Ornithodoros turicata TaxID=34597 RepID=UPI003139920E